MKLLQSIIQSHKDYTLFLDRDGVINRKLEADYVKHWNDFDFLPKVLDALKIFNGLFQHIVVVTNQQGVGKKLMSHKDLNKIHTKMLSVIADTGGRIDNIYFAPQLQSDNSIMRKPNIGMALQAQKDFPAIDFNKSIICGDSASDMAMGKRLNMCCIAIANPTIEADYYSPSLIDLVN